MNVDKQRMADAVTERLLKAKPGSKVSVTADEMAAFLEMEKLKYKVPAPAGVITTLQERGARYGDFTDHAGLAQALQDVMRNFEVSNSTPTETFSSIKPWDVLTPVQKQALTVIADKVARILSGDPTYADNWHDIQGYAKLVEDRLPKEIK